ncbi:MAG: hypothetical protein ACI9LN_002699, partial [Saprospiraceae bacterium]
MTSIITNKILANKHLKILLFEATKLYNESSEIQSLASLSWFSGWTIPI